MTGNRARLGLAFVLVIFVFSAVTLLYWNFVRDTIVVPIYYFLWVGSLILKSIPQGVYLAFLVGIALVMSLNTLKDIRVRPSSHQFAGNRAQAETRAQHWHKLYANLYASRFSRNLFTSEARRLILSILAYEHGIDPSEAEALVRSDALDVPETIGQLIRHHENPNTEPPPEPTSGLLERLRQRFFRTAPPANPQIDALVAEILNFIELHLEISYAGNQSES